MWSPHLTSSSGSSSSALCWETALLYFFRNWGCAANHSSLASSRFCSPATWWQTSLTKIKQIKDLHLCNQLGVPGCQLCCCLESLSWGRTRDQRSDSVMESWERYYLLLDLLSLPAPGPVVEAQSRIGHWVDPRHNSPTSFQSLLKYKRFPKSHPILFPWRKLVQSLLQMVNHLPNQNSPWRFPACKYLSHLWPNSAKPFDQIVPVNWVAHIRELDGADSEALRRKDPRHNLKDLLMVWEQL